MMNKKIHQTFSKFLSEELDKERVNYTIKGRSKSIYSIHRKMLTQNILLKIFLTSLQCGSFLKVRVQKKNF